jgi:hypothetical protein
MNRSAEHQDQQFAIILENVERRQKIEAEMLKVMQDMHLSMGEVEALLREACDGRERAMRDAMK